jgi:hypothetical protein
MTNKDRLLDLAAAAVRSSEPIDAARAQMLGLPQDTAAEEALTLDNMRGLYRSGVDVSSLAERWATAMDQLGVTITEDPQTRADILAQIPRQW